MTTQHIAAQLSAYLSSALASPTELVALFAAAVAGGLQISSSFVKTMVPLRWLAVLSNFGFLGYGVLHPSFVMALMHGILLPINVVRLTEMTRLTRRVHAATHNPDRSGIWLRPYMKSSKRKAGDVLFRKGDEAEHLYILVEGRVDFPEVNVSVKPGEIFGEIAFFSPERRRTLSAAAARTAFFSASTRAPCGSSTSRTPASASRSSVWSPAGCPPTSRACVPSRSRGR